MVSIYTNLYIFSIIWLVRSADRTNRVSGNDFFYILYIMITQTNIPSDDEIKQSLLNSGRDKTGKVIKVNEYEDKVEAFLKRTSQITFEEFRNMQFFFIHAVLYVAGKQETKEDTKFFTLFAYNMMVQYMLFFHDTFDDKNEYMQLGGVREWIIRNGEPMNVDETDIQKGDIPLSVAGGFRYGNRVFQYANESLQDARQNETVVPEQMFRDPVPNRFNVQQQQMLESLQLQEQILAVENRLRDLQRTRELGDVTHQERRRVLEGRIPPNEIITSVGLSAAMGFVCCITMETARVVVENQVTNITTGVAQAVTGTVTAVGNVATSEYVPKGVAAVGSLLYHVGSYTSESVAQGANYISSLFVEPEVANLVTDSADMARSQADTEFSLPKNAALYETLWTDCLQATGRTSFQCGMAVAACAMCCMYRQSVIRANDTKRRLVLGARMMDEEKQENERQFNQAARMVAASILTGPLGVGMTLNPAPPAPPAPAPAPDPNLRQRRHATDKGGKGRYGLGSRSKYRKTWKKRRV